jgi:hypothetical protein
MDSCLMVRSKILRSSVTKIPMIACMSPTLIYGKTLDNMIFRRKRRKFDVWAVVMMNHSR